MVAVKRKYTDESHSKMVNPSYSPNNKRPPFNHRPPFMQRGPPHNNWRPSLRMRGPSDDRGPPPRWRSPPPMGGREPWFGQFRPGPRHQYGSRDPYVDEFRDDMMPYHKGRSMPSDPYLQDPYYKDPYYENSCHEDPYYQPGSENTRYKPALEEDRHEVPQDYDKPKQQGFDGQYGADDELKAEIMDKIMFGDPSVEPSHSPVPTNQQSPPHRQSPPRTESPPHRQPPPHRHQMEPPMMRHPAPHPPSQFNEPPMMGHPPSQFNEPPMMWNPPNQFNEPPMMRHPPPYPPSQFNEPPMMRHPPPMMRHRPPYPPSRFNGPPRPPFPDTGPRMTHQMPQPLMKHPLPRLPSRVKVLPRPLVPDRAPKKMPSVNDKNTVKTLMLIRPDAKFKEIFNYGCDVGNCVCWSIQFADAIFEAEATTPYIAKALAAYDALAHLGAPGYRDCELICNTLDESRAVQINREAFIDKKLLDYEEQERSTGEGRTDQQTLNYIRANIKGSMDILSRKSEKFDAMRKLYGYGKLEIEDFFGEHNQVAVRVNISLYDGRYTFTECGHDKRAALYNLALRAEQVIPDKATWENVDDPNRYKSFQEHIVEKAHSFTQLLLAEYPPYYVRQHNYTCIIKVVGEEELIDKCEIVAFGNGTKIIDKNKMKSDGTVINDCCGEALAYRAFRRYILNQIELCNKGEQSIFIRDPITKLFELMPEIKFILFKNYSPFGDARYFDIENEPKEARTTAKKNAKKFKKKQNKADSFRKAWVYKVEDEGKVQLYKLHDTTISTHRDLTAIPKDEDDDDMFHCIVSPSDKMALRAICGCQGALLSLLLKDSIYMTEYQFHVGKSVSASRTEALERGLYGRLAGGTYEDPCPKPVIRAVKANWMRSNVDKDDIVPYSFLWFEGGNVDIIRSNEGKSVHRLRPPNSEILSVSELETIEKQELLTAVPSKYCTANYYTIFTYVCKILDIDVASYVEMKNKAEKYMRNKLAVYEELRRKGLGEWPEKHIFANF